AGYKGSAEMTLAMERGEVQGIGNWHYSSILANRPDWLREKKITLILQLGLDRHPELPAIPTVLDVARSDEQKEILQLVFAQQSLGRPTPAPPDIPAAQREALQTAFAAMMRDPQFLAEAERSKIEIVDPMPGVEAKRLLDRLHTADPALIRK